MWRTATLLTAVLCSSCLVGPYSKHDVGNPSSVVKGPTRPVPVGVRYSLASAGDRDLGVTVRGVALCRDATFGDTITTQDYMLYKRTGLAGVMTTVGVVGWIVGFTMFFSGLAGGNGDATLGAEITIPSVYLFIVGFRRLMDNDHSGTEVVSVKPGGSVWSSDTVGECPEGMTAALEPRTLRIDVRFESGGSYYREAHSDPGGTATVSGFVANVARVAAECGDATMTISDVTDPGVVGGDEPGERFYAETGTPQAIKTIAIPAKRIQRTINGAKGGPLSVLPTTERSLAEQCHAGRRATCVASLDATAMDEIATGCEDTCARQVDATACLLAARDCFADTQDAGEKAICKTGRTRCFDAIGVEEADLDTCTQACTAASREEACQ